MDAFTDLGTIMVIAVTISFVMKYLKQPLIIGYILTGIVTGPYVFNIISSKESIELLSKIGIAILLFVTGLNLNPKIIKDVGKISIIVGLGQVLFTSLIGFVICISLGFPAATSLYISIALTFSSTIIILKLLSDKGDLDNLYGKISIGALIVQDIVASLILIGVSTISHSNSGQPIVVTALYVFTKGFVLTIILVFIVRKILPKINSYISSSHELLYLYSLAWGIGLAVLFEKLGFSIEIGALAAGICLSGSVFSIEVSSRLKPLRDFFILQFFIFLGYQITFGTLFSQLGMAFFLSLFVLVGNPIIVFIIMNLLGYKRRVGFLTGLTVAQISEFSLILIALGISVGHIHENTLSLVTLVGIITISGSTYFILHCERVYKFASPILKLLEIRKIPAKLVSPKFDKIEAVLFGYDRVGKHFVKSLKKLGVLFVVVDYNPESIKKLQSENIPSQFGDAEDIEFLEELDLKNVKIIISTIPDHKTNILIVNHIQKVSPNAISIIISHDIKETEELYKTGATFVIMPHQLGAIYTTHLINKFGLDKKKYEQRKFKYQNSVI